MDKSIIGVIKDDCEEILNLFGQFDQPKFSETDSIRGFAKLKTKLISHIRSEDMALINQLRPIENLNAIAIELRQDHRLMEKLLKALETGQKDDSQWFLRLDELKQAFTWHAAKLERKIFAVIGLYFLPAELRSMGAEFKRVESALNNDPRQVEKDGLTNLIEEVREAIEKTVENIRH